MTDFKTISIVIPVYNEEEFITKTLQKVIKSNTLGLHKEIVIVNDGSTDDTSHEITSYIKATAKKLKKRIQKNEQIISFKSDTLTVIFYDKKYNTGKGASLKKGFALTSGDLVLVQDADLEYSPDDYPIMIEPFLKDDVDVVYGSRFISDRPHRVLYFWHSIGNRMLTLFSNMFTNLNLTDMETGFKAFRGTLIRSITKDLEASKFGFEPEITARISKIRELTIYEVGISYFGRTYAEGKKIGWKDGVRAIKEIIRFNLMPKKTWWYKKLTYIVRVDILEELKQLVILPKDKWRIFLLVLIVLVTLYTRTAGLKWGLITGDINHGSPYHDEGHTMGIVFDPNYFNVFGEYEISKEVYFYRVVAGKINQLAHVIGQPILTDWVLVRTVSVLFGILSVVVVYLLGAVLFNINVGLTAAIFLILMPGHWFMSQLIKGEVTITFFIPAVILTAHFLYKRKKLIWYVLMGLLVGTGISTKATFLTIGPALVLFGIVLLIKNRLVWKKIIQNSAIALVIAFACFIYFYPYPFCCMERYQQVLQDPQNAFQRASFERFSLTPEHAVEIWNLFESPDYPYFTIMFGEAITYLFWFGMLAIVISILYSLFKKEVPIIKIMLILGFIFFYFVLDQYGGINEDRYIVPLAPYLALFTAYLFWGDHILRNKLSGFFTLAGILVISYTAVFSYTYWKIYLWEPRNHVAYWLNDHATPEKNTAMIYILSARDRIHFNKDKVSQVTIEEVNSGKVKPDFIVLYKTISYKGRWGNDVFDGPIREKPYGDVIPKLIKEEYTKVHTVGEIPVVFGDPKPEAFFTPVYDIYEKK